MSEKQKWIKISDSVEEIYFGANNLAEVMVDEKRICIGKHKDELFAFAAKCPHASGFFVEGWIDSLGNVVCPVHHYKFCMRNGRNVSGEGYYLKHWAVDVRGDGVYVGMDEQRFFGLF